MSETSGGDELPPPAQPSSGKWRTADIVGAALIVVAVLGLASWGWAVVREQFVLDEADSVAERFDQLAARAPVLLLAAVVGGVGVGLRNWSADRASVSRSALARPFVPMLLGAVAVIAAVVVGAGLLDDDEPTIDSAFADQHLLDVVGDPASRLDHLMTTVPPEPTHSLEVHSDGCGVFRSGEIGDDLTWVITDQDGFEVLSRNAAGEIQYRYFQPGTYTVVLERFGPGYYVEVSNQVTITC